MKSLSECLRNNYIYSIQNHRMRRVFYFLFFIFCFAPRVHAQLIENAGDYMTAMSNAQVVMDQKYMAYISASAHSRRAKKVEKLRSAALESINNAKYKT